MSVKVSLGFEIYNKKSRCLYFSDFRITILKIILVNAIEVVCIENTLD
jgi:hypothetical protein